MRVVVDLQACQSRASRHRGIGRYSMALLQAMLRNAGSDEIWVALNGELADTIEPIRAALYGLMPEQRIVIWKSIGDTVLTDAANRWRHAAACITRQAFLEELKPDVVHIASLFEGYVDDTVATIGESGKFLTAVTLYDLIPLVFRDVYLAESAMQKWYLEKIEELKRADLLLGISEYTCREAIERLGVPARCVANLSAAVDPMFRPSRIEGDAARKLLSRLGIARRFMMYTGGFDHRKNMQGLIKAYALMPEALRKTCQLVIVCHSPPEARRSLINFAANCGLAPDEMVLTDYVSDADLQALYNLCHALVFPSLYEGFGLPVLEAMASGAAVIGANASSVPEVVGCDEALFDPLDVREMATKMERVLTDDGFRQRLRTHGLKQAKRFSWDQCGQRALAAMRDAVARGGVAANKHPAEDRSKPLLAYISPVPPQRSGVADYSAELLPALSEYYRIEVISDQEAISDPWLHANLPLRSNAYFEENAAGYDRVLYHIGNGLLHAEMLMMLDRHPGTVVLHEVFLSGITANLEWASKAPGYWTRSLYASHGYPALIDWRNAADPERMLERYPCSFEVIRDAHGIIVHSQFARELADRWFGAGTSRDWSVVPHLRVVPERIERERSRKRLGLKEHDLLVCCFGIIGAFKRNHELLRGWLASSLARDRRCRLVFVGGGLHVAYEDELRKLIAASGCADRIEITGWADQQTYRGYLSAADIAVQLRGSSRGEASGTAHDCLAYGVAAIVNEHGPFAELPPNAVRSIPDDFTDAELAAALEILSQDATLRRRLGERGQEYCRSELKPEHIAALYQDAIESAARSHPGLSNLTNAIAAIDVGVRPGELDLDRLATGIAANARPCAGIRQLLVDISELVRRDAKSGIQRVVRSVLAELIASPPPGFRVEPVYANPGERLRYARAFMTRFLGLQHAMPPDEPIEVDPGDVFLGLDLSMPEISANLAEFRDMRNRGVPAWFVVHDVLPVARSDCFASHIHDVYVDWARAIIDVGEGAICVSRTVAEELQRHFDAMQPARERPFHIGWFHHGADIGSSVPTRGISLEDQAALSNLRGDVFLTVGTLEPRKGHTQTLAAFELLWAQDTPVKWVIVGKPGWMTESLTERLCNHPENGRRLFWFTNASDELLVRLYEQCSALLVASEGEGFGLPLIEAAQHGLPILCRDLPVFCEVAGEHATYFSGYTPENIAVAIRDWLDARAEGDVSDSRGLPRSTWREATGKLLDTVLRGKHYVSWIAGERYWFPAYDRRLSLPNGTRDRDRIVSDGPRGVMFGTWPIAARCGGYHLRVLGEWLSPQRDAYVELTAINETTSLATMPLDPDSHNGVLLDADIVITQDVGNMALRIVTGAGTRLAVSGCGIDPMPSRATDQPAVGSGETGASKDIGPASSDFTNEAKVEMALQPSWPIEAESSRGNRAR